MAAPILLLLFIVGGVVCDVPSGLLAAGACGAASLSLISPAACRRALIVAAAASLCGSYAASARDATLQSALTVALAPVLDDRFAPPVWLSGVLRDDATVDADGARLSLDVDRVRFDDAVSPWRFVSGRAQIGVGGSITPLVAHDWVRGRRITAPVLVKRPQIWLNPGGPSERWQRLRRGVDVTGSVKSAALVDVAIGPPWSEFAARIRRHVRVTIDRAVGPDAHESAGILTAILIGDRTGLDDATVRRLQMAGTYHVIAISGGNIAIVVAVCLFGLRLFVRSPRLIAAITMAVVLMYGGLVGDQPSVSRAVTASVVVLGLQCVGWCAPALRVFVVAALIVALAEPLAVIDVGAWLSFGATLGILLVAKPIAAWLSRGGGRVASLAGGMLAATVAAEVALMPISAAVFSRVSVAGLLLNFVAIPAMAVAQLASTVAVVVAPLSPLIARAAGAIARAGAVMLVRSADLVDVMPWLSWQTPPGWPGWIVIYYGGVTLALWGATPRRLSRICVFAAAGSLAMVLWSPVASGAGPPAGFLRIAMLDVGQGQSIAVQFPTGQSLLLDTGGSASSFDIGARIVEPVLWSLGIQRLDWLALTHGDIDHSGGAPSVLRDLRPREVWEGVPVPNDLRMQSLRADAHDDGVVWRRLASGHNLEVGSVLLDVLNPPLPDWERRATRNNDSLVMRLDFGRVSVLLTGDVERPAEDGLSLDRGPRLRVISAPHHGSRTSSSPGFLAAFLPQAAFVSAGRGNSFGHPSLDVLARYEQLGVEVFRTDRDGAILIETDGRSLNVRTMSGRVWHLSYVETGPGME
jgi:competence protein ComEC